MNSTGLCYHCDNSIFDTDEVVTFGPIRLHKTCVEDYLDTRAYDHAMAEHRKNPVTYSMKDVERMLEDE